MIEYRVCWTSSSNITFHGKSEWTEWGGFEETADEVETALTSGGGAISDGLAEALDASGFEWWVETRVASEA